MRVLRLIALFLRPQFAAGMLFFALASSIVGNALFMQPAQVSRPLVPTQEAALTEVEMADTDLIIAIQTELQHAGYYGGKIDGLAGTQTTAAIMTFEANSGRPESGRASFELLSTLRSANRQSTAALPPAEPAAPANTQPASQPLPAAVGADPQVAAVQDALARSAYGPLTPDGVFGPQTRDAIMRFQHDRGLEVTGAINDALVLELRAAGALE